MKEEKHDQVNRSTKKRAERTILEDGLVDIIMGIYILLSSFCLINRKIILNYIWLPIGLVIIDVIRRKYIYPRTGYARIKISAKDILLVLSVTVLGLLLTGLLVGFLVPSIHILKGGWNGVVSYGLAITTIIFFGFLAKRFDIPRWYIHGILFGFVFILYRSLETPFVVFALGVIVSVIGVVVFINFLRKYTPSNGETSLFKEGPNVS